MTAENDTGKSSAGSLLCILIVVVMSFLVSGCGGHDDISTSAQQSGLLSCDDSMKAAFKPDANTTVVFVKQFKAGSSYALANTPASPAPPVAATDVCLVKLLVGPGNPGPAGAPSTSAGIGIEVWLPMASAWNNIIRATGSGGWAGGAHAAADSFMPFHHQHRMTLPGNSNGGSQPVRSGSDNYRIIKPGLI